jgi:hypothetical protein
MLTQCRAAWLASGAVCLLVGPPVILAALRHGGHVRRCAFGLLAVVCAACVAGVILLWDMIAGRFNVLALGGTYGLIQRVTVWTETLAMIRSNPFGVGCGCFGEMYLRFKQVPDRMVALRAHNEVLQVTAELGWLAVPLIAWFLSAACRRAVSAARSTGSPGGTLQTCLWGAISVMILHSMVDFPLRLPANALFFTAMLGAVVAAQPGPAPDSVRPVRPGAGSGLLACVCLILAVWWATVGISAGYANSGMRLMHRADFPPAMSRFRTACRLMPLDPGPALQRGRIAYTWSRFADRARKEELLNEALRELDRSARIAPHRAMTHVWRARVLRDLGRTVRAEEAFRAAIECDRYLGLLHSYYADFLLDQGRHNEAARAYRLALSVFHDSTELSAIRVFEKLYDASGDASIVKQACPDDTRARQMLSGFLGRVEKQK